MAELDLSISNHLLDFFLGGFFICLSICDRDLAIMPFEGHNGSVYYESALERCFDVGFPLLDLHPGGRYIL